MFELIIVAAVVGLVVGAVIAWKVKGGLDAAAVHDAERVRDALQASFKAEQDAHLKVRQALADERKRYADDARRHEDAEGALKAELERARQELNDAARKDPARAGDRLDGVLGGPRRRT
jgi:Skp family chaperone for outer membrane proteins